jgi:hypothetical protein
LLPRSAEHSRMVFFPQPPSSYHPSTVVSTRLLPSRVSSGRIEAGQNLPESCFVRPVAIKTPSLGVA